MTTLLREYTASKRERRTSHSLSSQEEWKKTLTDPRVECAGVVGEVCAIPRDHVVPALHHNVNGRGHFEVSIGGNVSALKKKNGGYLAER